MIEPIKSRNVKKVNDSFNFESLSEKELEIMSEFDVKDLSEFLYLINQSVISHNILSAYFVVYNQNLVKDIEKKFKYNFINELFAKAWLDNFQDRSPNDLLDMLLGLSLINTDILSRIRKGLEFDSKKLTIFESKISVILKILIDRIDEGSFYKTLTSVNLNDKDALDDEENNTFLNFKNDLKALSNAFELYDINHGNFKDKEYLKNNSKQLILYENQLRTSLKSYFTINKLDEIYYIPEIYKEVIIGAITGDNNVKLKENAVVKEKKSKKKDNDLLSSISTIDIDDEKIEPVFNSGEDKLFGAVDRMVNSKKKEKDKTIAEDKTPLGSRDLIVGMEIQRESSASSFFKWFVALLVVLSVIGWGLSVRSTNNEGADHVQELTYNEILSYKMSSGGEMKYDMKINRSPNIGNISNGSIKDSAPNIE